MPAYHSVFASWPVLLCLVLNTAKTRGEEGGSFALDKSSYVSGEGMTFTWSRPTAAAARDWIGIYKPADTPGGVASTLWFYLDGSQTPPVAPIASGSYRLIASPLATGNWVARFFLDDGYTESFPSVSFTVTSPPTSYTTPPTLVVPKWRLRHAVVGIAYASKVGAIFADRDPGDILTVEKIAGPAWLSVATNGGLSGTPGESDAGEAVLTLRATDRANNQLTGLATLHVFRTGEERVERLSVMTFNIWVGAGSVADGLRKGLQAVMNSDADIVGIQENGSAAGTWATALGWFSVQTGDNAVLSRYPFASTSASVEATVRLAASPQQDVVLRSLHLTAYPYGPYDACLDGASLSTLIARESSSGRLSQAQSQVAALNAKLAAADTTPVFLVGDFNCPSHLDWTEATASLHCGYVVDWPVTKKLADAGFSDVYRLIHPNPATHRGDTWSPVFTRNGSKPEPQDRIDMIHHKGAKLVPIDARVFTLAVEKTNSNYQSNTWPSDHAAVVADYFLRPVDADADGLGDAWEQQHFGNLMAHGGAGDPDADGCANSLEHALDGNPLRADWGSIFSFEIVEGAAVMQFAARAVAGLSIQVSDDLLSWIPANPPDLTGAWSPSGLPLWEWRGATSTPRAYYRLGLTSP
ncbi:MAG: endonuclease/exonuclease/phosphatase family protein [Verrucomicrobiales bacterium]